VVLDEFERARNLTARESDELHQRVDPKIIQVSVSPSSRAGRIGLAQSQWLKWLDAIEQALEHKHASNPDIVGPIESDLIRAASAIRVQTPLRGSSARIRSIAVTALRSLIEQGQVVRQGARLRKPGHRPTLAPADQALLDRVTTILRDSALRPPIVGELASCLGLERAELLTFLREMGHKGHLLAISQNRFFLPETLAELAAIARQLAAESVDGYFDAAAYRDASGIGRNLTIDVLEFLDRAGITRYAGERRSIIG
jgi:selenocysteine-specific elongation factor